MTTEQMQLIENYIRLKVKKLMNEGPNQDKEFYAKKVSQNSLNKWIKILTKVKSEMNEYDPMLFNSLEEILFDIQIKFQELEKFMDSRRR